MTAGVTVRVPGSTSNLGSGFDCAGMAVERWLRLSARYDESQPGPATIERRGTLRELGVRPEDDLIYRGFTAAWRIAGRGRELPRVSLTADSDIPVGRGLGSSAAAIVAGAAAAAALLGIDLEPETLLTLGAEIEGHPDNVAPAVYGGATLVLHRPTGGFLAAPLDVHPAIAFVFAVPDFTLETKRARAALPASVPHATASIAAARGAALVRGLATGDPELLAIALDDVLHVPYRRELVRGYDAVTSAARAAGAHGATLSGSGPTVVALAPLSRSSAVADAMRRAWQGTSVVAESFVVSRRVASYGVTQGFE
jgi:homoserine kinase